MPVKSIERLFCISSCHGVWCRWRSHRFEHAGHLMQVRIYVKQYRSFLCSIFLFAKFNIYFSKFQSPSVRATHAGMEKEMMETKGFCCETAKQKGKRTFWRSFQVWLVVDHCTLRQRSLQMKLQIDLFHPWLFTEKRGIENPSQQHEKKLPPTTKQLRFCPIHLFCVFFSISSKNHLTVQCVQIRFF